MEAWLRDPIVFRKGILELPQPHQKYRPGVVLNFRLGAQDHLFDIRKDALESSVAELLDDPEDTYYFRSALVKLREYILTSVVKGAPKDTLAYRAFKPYVVAHQEAATRVWNHVSKTYAPVLETLTRCEKGELRGVIEGPIITLKVTVNEGTPEEMTMGELCLDSDELHGPGHFISDEIF